MDDLFFLFSSIFSGLIQVPLEIDLLLLPSRIVKPRAAEVAAELLGLAMPKWDGSPAAPTRAGLLRRQGCGDVIAVIHG